jgi:hypothetical protein
MCLIAATHTKGLEFHISIPFPLPFLPVKQQKSARIEPSIEQF